MFIFSSWMKIVLFLFSLCVCWFCLFFALRCCVVWTYVTAFFFYTLWLGFVPLFSCGWGWDMRVPWAGTVSAIVIYTLTHSHPIVQVGKIPLNVAPHNSLEADKWQSCEIFFRPFEHIFPLQFWTLARYGFAVEWAKEDIASIATAAAAAACMHRIA